MTSNMFRKIMIFIKEKFNRLQSDISINKSSIGIQKKNFLMNNCKDFTKNGVTASINSDGSIKVTGTSTSTSSFLLYWNLQTGKDTSNNATSQQYIDNKKWIPTGKYILSGGTDKVRLQIKFSELDNNEGDGATNTGGDTYFEILDSHKYVWSRLLINGNAGTINETIYPMIRPADVEDSTYEPYIEDLQTQINNKRTAGIGEPLPKGANLDNYITPGVYYCDGENIYSSIINAPFNDGSFRLEVLYINNIQRYVQIVTKMTIYTQIHIRTYTGDGWGGWKRFLTYDSNYILKENDNLNNYVVEGVYYSSSANISKSLINGPELTTFASARLEVCPMNSYATTASVIQKYYPNIKSHGYYMRILNNSAWGSWFLYTGVEVKTYNPSTASSSNNQVTANPSSTTQSDNLLESNLVPNEEDFMISTDELKPEVENKIDIIPNRDDILLDNFNFEE